MAKTPVTLGCASRLTHIAHTWKAVVHGRRGDPQDRWCPGRVRCVKCKRAVFTTTATPVPDSRNEWACTRPCRS